MLSTNSKIKKIIGLQGTKDLTEWEEEFVESIRFKTQGGNLVGNVTEKQLDVIDRIHKKHFGD